MQLHVFPSTYYILYNHCISPATYLLLDPYDSSTCSFLSHIQHYFYNIILCANYICTKCIVAETSRTYGIRHDSKVSEHSRTYTILDMTPRCQNIPQHQHTEEVILLAVYSSADTGSCHGQHCIDSRVNPHLPIWWQSRNFSVVPDHE